MARIKQDAPQSAPTTAGGVSLGSTEAAKPASVSTRIPCGPFVLTQHPQLGWYVFEGKIRPDLRRKALDPGMNGATLHSKGAALTAFREKGLTVLDAITAEYLVRAPVPGGFHHHFRWERLIPGTTESRPDLAGYGAWLDTLVTRGHVKPPTPDALYGLLGRLQRSGAPAADIAVVEAALAEADVATLEPGDGVEL